MPTVAAAKKIRQGERLGANVTFLLHDYRSGFTVRNGTTYAT